MNYNNFKIKYGFIYLFMVLMFFLPIKVNAVKIGNEITIYSTGPGNVDGLNFAKCVDDSSSIKCPDWYYYFYTKDSSSNSYMKMFCVAPTYESVPSQKGSTYYYLGSNYDISGVGAACAYINNNIDSKYINWNIKNNNSNLNYIANDRLVRKYVFDNIGSKTKCNNYTKDTSISENYCNSKNQSVNDNTESSIKVGVGKYSFISNDNNKYQQAKITISKTGKISNYNIKVSGVNNAIITATDSATDVTNITNSSATTLYVKVPFDKITDTSKVLITVEGSYELKCNYIKPVIKVYYPSDYVNDAGNALSETGKKYYNSVTGLYKTSGSTSAIQAIGYFENVKDSVKKTFTKKDSSSTIPPKLSNLRIRKIDYQSNLITEGQAQFGLYTDKECKNLYGSYQNLLTDDGIMTVNNLPIGTYYIKETKTPTDKYVKPANNCKKVELKTNNNTYTVDIINDKKPIVIITKYETDTVKKLTGSKFNVYYGDTCSGTHEEITLTSGSYTFDTLSAGSKLRIQETVSPEGYTLNNSCIDLSSYLVLNSTTNVPIYNNKKENYVIQKIDSNNNIIKETAEFSIYKNEGDCNSNTNPISTKPTIDGVVSFSLDKNDGYYFKEKKAPQGYVIDSTCKQLNLLNKVKNNKKIAIEIIKTGDSKKVSGEKINLNGVGFELFNNSNCIGDASDDFSTNNNGVIKFELSAEGKYSIKEKKYEGYKISDNNCTPINNANDLLFNNKYEVEIYNELAMSDLEITKQDDDGNLLSGVKFGLFSDDASCNTDPISTKLTIDGVVEFSGLDSRNNIYYKEIDIENDNDGYITIAGVNYKIDSNCYKANLVPGKTTKVVLYNHKLENLIIEKKNIFGEGLENAEFSIYENENDCKSDSNKVVYENQDKFVTDDRGLISLPLKDDEFWVKETKAPDGYKLSNNNCEQVNLLSNNESNSDISNSVTFINDKYPKVTVKKLSVSGEFINGVKFKLYETSDSSKICSVSGSKLVNEYTTMDNGVFITDSLDPNNYYFLLESDADQSPDYTEKYYVLGNGCTIINDKDTNSISLNNDKEITIYNGKKSSISFTKLDYLGNPVKDIKFYLDVPGKDNSIETYETTSTPQGLVKFSGLELSNSEPTNFIIREDNSDKYIPVDDRTIEFDLSGIDYYSDIILDNFINIPYSSLKVLKVDNNNNNNLSGAEFDLYKSNLNNTCAITGYSKIAGRIINDGMYFDKLESGNYCIKETKAPEGYIENSTPIFIGIEKGESAIQVVHNTSKPILKIYKKDSFGNPLKDAEFNIYKTDNYGKCTNDVVVENLITGLDGYAISNDHLEKDLYCVKEIKAPDGYKINNASEIVDLESENEVLVVFENDVMPELTILKVGEDGKYLKDAEFNICSNNNCDDIKKSGLITNDDGIVITTLEAGKYYVKEIKAPEGYQLNKEPFEIDLKENEKTVLVVTDNLKRNIKITKVGSVNNAPVKDVQFDLYKDSNCSDKMDSKFTDNNGVALFNGLDDGKYYVKEYSVPYGYLKDNTCYEVVAGNEDFVVKNDQYFDLTIEKKDAITNTPIEGVKFRLCLDSMCNKTAVHYDGSKITDDELITNSNGILTIKGLSSGKYYYQEIKTADGYVLPDAISGILINDNMTLVVKNSKYNLEINKVSLENEKVNLPGSKINIVDLSSETLDLQSFVSTDKNSIVSVSPGIYAIYEVDAPDGFIPLESGLIFKINSKGEYEKYVGDYSQYESVIGIPLEVESDNYIVDGNSIKIVNKPTYVILSKADVTSAKEVPGATVIIYDSNNHEVVKFISDDKGPKLFYLEPGEYTLKETIAPKGYKKLTSTFKFTLTEGGTILTDNKDESYFVKGDTIIIYNGMDTINVPITGLSKDVIVILIGILLIGGGFGIIFFKKKKESLK